MTVLYCLPSKQAEAAWRKGNQGYVAMVMLSSASLRRQKSETTRISTAPSVSLVGVLVNHLMRATGQQKLWKSVGWWNTVLWIGLHFISKDTKACVCVCVCVRMCVLPRASRRVWIVRYWFFRMSTFTQQDVSPEKKESDRNRQKEINKCEDTVARDVFISVVRLGVKRGIYCLVSGREQPLQRWHSS